VEYVVGNLFNVKSLPMIIKAGDYMLVNDVSGNYSTLVLTCI